MAAGKYKAIAVGPGRLSRVVTHNLVVEQVCDGGQSHGRARMSTFGGLNGIHREGADCINRELFNFVCFI